MFAAGPNVVGSSSTVYLRFASRAPWMRLAQTTLAVCVVTGCTPSSQMARPSGPPTGPYPVAGAPADRFAAASRPGFAPTAPGGGPYSNGAQPTGQVGGAMTGGQSGGAEIVPTPRPDNRGPGPEVVPTPRHGPAVAPNCPPGVPGQGPVPGPPPKPVPWWRGFLPAHGTNEDRPGWWTPDYGGGTSA